MRNKIKNGAIMLLAMSSALCLGGALALHEANRVTASAEEVNYKAFVNVGANADAQLIDEALGLTAKGATATTAGTVTAGGTLFTSYAEGATYSFELSAGTYQVAVAIIAEAETGVTVGGTAATVTGTGKQVVSTTATVAAGTPLTVAVSGKLCGVLVADEDSKVLMTADYTAGQVISYGALLSEELDGATGYYSDGTTAELKINYENVTAGGGVNVNFTTIDVTGTVEGTNLKVSRYVITMPDDLVYFINCGSSPVDGKYVDTADAYYAYNQTLLNYYGKLLNDQPDNSGVSKGGNDWGCYTASTFTAPGDATFPYNTLRWTDEAVDMGYMLTKLTANANYRIYIGTLSAWHARTVKITFNGNVVGADNLRINASKGYTVYENVPADANGKIDLHMQGASTNEPCINFIAVQSMETAVAEVPATPQGSATVGMEDTSITLSGLTEGAKVQMYNAAKPNQFLYEELVDPEKIAADGSYLLDWGRVITEVSQFNIVQITNGGASEALLVSITDIEDFKVVLSPAGYTQNAVTVAVSAHANSGIAQWSYRLGEYGAETVFELGLPYSLNGSFEVEENGEYIVVVTSGLGVTYSETIEIANIDPDRPVITLTPSAQGWSASAYNVTLTVDSIAPVSEYTLYKNGTQAATSESAPATITFTEAGEYVIYVKTAAGRSATSSVVVSAQPTTTAIKKVYARRTLTYTFGDTENYKVASVEAYQVTAGGVTRMTIAAGNSMDVYSAGKYVITVTTENGTVEMFALEVSKDDLKSGGTSGGLSEGTALGVGLGVGLGGAAIAAAAVAVTFVLLKKKKS